MEDKLTMIQELLDDINEIRNLSPSSFTMSSEAQNVADDIAHKLLLIRKLISKPSSPSRQLLNTYVIFNGEKSPTSSTSSRKSSNLSMQRYFLTQAVLNDEENADPLEAARVAYDCENYAKCIRVIDKLLKRQNGALDSEMIQLCHDSYRRVLDDAATEKERFKLCEWWRLFLENVQLVDQCHDRQLQLIEFRTECLWERQRLMKSEDEKLCVIELLMNLKIEAYELTAVMYRPFHIQCLRRILKICALVVDFFEHFQEAESIPLCIEEAVELSRYAVDEARVDAVQYAKETDASNEDLCYLESMELIKEIDAILCSACCVEMPQSDVESECAEASTRAGGDIALRDANTDSAQSSPMSTTSLEVVVQKPRCVELQRGTSTLIVEEISALNDENCVTRF